MKTQILKEIKKIEKESKIKILFLIESGSRTWGWESEESNYDIRGIFTQDYLVVQNIDEQIDKKIGDLDITLWNFRKFLKLMIKSNPSVWEWLSSDIIYIKNSLRKKLKKIFEKDFSSFKLKKHYTSMAKQNFKKYITTQGNTTNLKKYVYVLRSIACVLWIEKHKSPPPKNYKQIIKLPPKIRAKFHEKSNQRKKKI